MAFEIGDKVVGVEVNPFEKLLDKCGVGLNSDMKYDWNKVKTIVRIRSNEINGVRVNFYELSDSFLYNEDWIKLETPKIIYHDNPKINKVILKIKSMEKSRKDKGYVY